MTETFEVLLQGRNSDSEQLQIQISDDEDRKMRNIGFGFKTRSWEFKIDSSFYQNDIAAFFADADTRNKTAQLVSWDESCELIFKSDGNKSFIRLIAELPGLDVNEDLGNFDSGPRRLVFCDGLSEIVGFVRRSVAGM